jgi:hypothetical protein
VLPWSAQAQVKLSGSYEFLWRIQASATLQNLPGIVVPTSYTFTNSLLAPTLGRNLGQCGGSAVCVGTLTAPLPDPNTLFERRETQLDIRFGKIFRAGRVTVHPRFDVYNLLNESSVQRVNGTIGPNWQQPLLILGGRTGKFGVQLLF